MGVRKFKLSNMIPIAWFYKLKNLNKSMNQNPNHSKPIKHHSSSSSHSSSLITTNSSYSSSSSLSLPQQTHLSHNRTSQYFKRDPPSNSSNTQFIDSPRKISRRRKITRRNRVSSSSPRRLIISTAHGAEKNPVSPTDNDKSVILKDSNFGKLLNLQLPPIVTKRVELKKTHIGKSSENVMNWSVRRLSVSSPAKMKKGRRSGSRLSESFAVVKSSVNPQKDFMESMVEMIVENEIEGSKDLEDLLVCYLQLNSDEYHELIIAVFKQIWFSVADNRLKKKKKKEVII